MEWRILKRLEKNNKKCIEFLLAKPGSFCYPGFVVLGQTPLKAEPGWLGSTKGAGSYRLLLPKSDKIIFGGIIIYGSIPVTTLRIPSFLFFYYFRAHIPAYVTIRRQTQPQAITNLYSHYDNQHLPGAFYAWFAWFAGAACSEIVELCKGEHRIFGNH